MDAVAAEEGGAGHFFAVLVRTHQDRARARVQCRFFSEVVLVD